VEAVVKIDKIQLHPDHLPDEFKAEAPSQGAVELSATPIQVTASCTANLDFPGQVMPQGNYANPRLAPWKLGFMQAQIEETRWAYYRGVESNHGCLLSDSSAGPDDQVHRDFDKKSDTVFYEGIGHDGKVILELCYGVPDMSKKPPWQLTAVFGDQPSASFPKYVIHSQTKRYNYLSEARLAIAFVTTLTEQFSPGKYKHHRHFFWSEIWHFEAPHLVSEPKKYILVGDKGFWISDFNAGPPPERYLAVLNNPSPKVQTAKDSAVERVYHPHIQEWPEWQEKSVWQRSLRGGLSGDQGRDRRKR
jgi:hypothetical protein